MTLLAQYLTGEVLGKMASEENKITKLGIELCRANPIVKRIYRTQSGQVRVKGGYMWLCPIGTPDVTGFTIDGRIIGIEFKTEKAFAGPCHGASDQQISHLLDIIEAGGLAGIACNNEHVKLILNGAPVGLESHLSIPDDREQLDLIGQ